MTKAQQCANEQGPPQGALYSMPDYTLQHLRLSCLQMALAAPDGAPPPPLSEVLDRAQAYWRFVNNV